MDRNFTVKYRKAGPAVETTGATNVEKRSMDMFDKDTDNDIFALGDAVQDAGFNFDLPDDIFKGFGLSISDFTNTLKNQQIVRTPQSPKESRGVGTSDDDVLTDENAPNPDVKVSTISKTLPDGRTVHTRIIQGPVRTTKKLIKINRELPNGELELVRTIEVPMDGSGGVTADAIAASMAGGGASSGGGGQPESGGQPSGSPHPGDQKSNMPGPFPVTPSEAIQEEPPPERRPNGSPLHLSQGYEHDPKRGSPNKKYGNKYDDDIQPFITAVTPTSDITIENETKIESRCFTCPKLWTTKRKSVPKGHVNDTGKGKSGMTQSEVNDDKPLPGLQGLVMNYARMLHEDKAQFIETLFRAVKLNKSDVTKILCKIIQKSGMKLSSHELREPESSASILHVALLYNHVEIVDSLMELQDSELILAKYETVEYHNQTGLHVAVANGNMAVVEKLLLMLDMPARYKLINTIADGKYFRNKHPHGQLCLTAAAWAGNGDIIKMLVHHGGNLALKNYDGNTLLHSVVLQSAEVPEKNDYEQLVTAIWEASEIWADQLVDEQRNAQKRALEQKQYQINLFRELLGIRNDDGYTALALSTITDSPVFRYLLNMEKIFKIPQNKLGSIAWVTYDVTEITSFAYDTYNKFSVLHILAHNSQQLSRNASMDKSDFDGDSLESEPIKTLMACKWGVYRWVYIVWMIIHFCYMIIFTAATAELNSSTEGININLTTWTDGTLPVHYGYVVFCLLPVIYICLEILDLFGNKPYRIQFMDNQNYFLRVVKCIKSEWTITGNGPYRLVNIAFSGFVMDWFMLYVDQDPDQDIALAMSLLLGWIFVLFFTRGCRVTCSFSIMIQKMFFRDLIYFLTVYGIILVGFSFAMNAMFTYLQDAERSISKVFYEMMNVVTDLDQKQSIDDARHPMLAKLLLIMYAIVAVILLMNMLIAMMNTSYETVRATRCNLWKQQQLSIMLLIERRFFWWKWLCRKSEVEVWKKGTDSDVRCYLDVTMLHTSNYKCGT